MKKICIFGDSWACGEWGVDRETGRYKVLHNGLQAYLGEKHDVVNLGRGGYSNNDAIKSLKISLEKNTYDLIFWFKTDPLRNLDPYHRFQASDLTFEDVKSWTAQESRDSYQKLHQLGVQIQCIGGAGKLNLAMINEFPNLVPYIPSLIEMLYPQYDHLSVWFSDWVRCVDRQFDLESIERFVKYKINQDILKTKPYRELFYPDGRHPNRHAHQILFDKICKDFDLSTQNAD